MKSSGPPSPSTTSSSSGVFIVVVFSLLVRGVLFFCGVEELLSRRKELVTPISSYDRGITRVLSYHLTVVSEGRAVSY
jgi:hypothetical protein